MPCFWRWWVFVKSSLPVATCNRGRGQSLCSVPQKRNRRSVVYPEGRGCGSLRGAKEKMPLSSLQVGALLLRSSLQKVWDKLFRDNVSLQKWLIYTISSCFCIQCLMYNMTGEYGRQNWSSNSDGQKILPIKHDIEDSVWVMVLHILTFKMCSYSQKK